MLDKTIPYYNIIMKRYSGTPIPEYEMDQRYRFEGYSPGTEGQWAKLMVEVGEFDHMDEALDYFRQDYAPYPEELKRRMLFIKDDNGEILATMTNWWRYTGERRDPTMEWVAVKPELQGQGLGKAIIREGMKRMLRIEGDRDFFLHTQTWSHRAVWIYLNTGYHIIKDEVFSDYSNDYEAALSVLNPILKASERK